MLIESEGKQIYGLDHIYQTENSVISINNYNHTQHTLLQSSVTWQLV